MAGNEGHLAIELRAVQGRCALALCLLAVICQVPIGICLTDELGPVSLTLPAEMLHDPSMCCAEMCLQIVQQVQAGDGQAAAVDSSHRKVINAAMMQSV